MSVAATANRVTPIRKRILGVAGLMAYVLVLAEIMVRILSSFASLYSIEMLKYAKALKVRSTVPGLSHEHRPGASARLMGVDVTLNALGHRSRPLVNPKPAGERRLHVIGDSIALAWGVPVERGFVALVEDRLNRERAPQTGAKYVTINAGIGNVNAAFKTEIFKRQVDLTNPDWVVLQYYIRDAEPDPVGDDSFILQYSLFAATVYQNVRTITAVRAEPLAEHYLKLYGDGRPTWERTIAAFRELKRLCDDRHLPLTVLIVPELHNLAADGPYPPIYRKVGATFAEMGVDAIDAFPAVAAGVKIANSEAWIARDDPHPSPEVHRILADALYHKITTAGF